MNAVKNLGVYFDRYMSFEQHIDEIHKKVMGTLIYLNRVKDSFEPSTRVMVVQALAMSIINYCLKVWGATNNTQIQRVQKLQNFAARVAIGNISKYDRISPALKKLEWLKIKDKYVLDICTFVLNNLRKNFPDWLYNFLKVNEVSDVITRQRDDLFIRRAKSDIGAREINVRGPQLYNKLPLEIRDAGSVFTFKNSLKKLLLNGNMQMSL